jgi:hypothetical protein
MTTTEIKTWANLKTDTPFNQFFPDGKVPLKSIVPMKPRDEDSPVCYLVDGSKLTDAQIDGLAEMLLPMWAPECATKEQAVEYIRDGLPLKCEWFSGVTSTDHKVFMALIDDRPNYNEDDWEEGACPNCGSEFIEWDTDDECERCEICGHLF